MAKRLKCMIRGAILCFGMLMVLCIVTESDAAKRFDINVSAKDKTVVEISWKKQSVTGYEIYRAKANKSGGYNNYKKIATVSGKKTKYIDKTVKCKNWYCYKVKAYEKQGNKKNYKYVSFLGETYTDMGIPEVFLNSNLDVSTTADSIRFKGDTYGIAPTAFEIYRKKGSSKYKKIKTVKVKDGSYNFEYVDKKVTKGKNYTYKVRAYRAIKGKKWYSQYSKPVKLTAINNYATYTVQNDTQKNGKTKSIVVGLTSNEGNGNTLFKNHCYWENEDSEFSDWIEVELVPVKYSFDNINWIPFPDKGVKLSEYQTIYIMLEEKNGKKFDFYSSDVYVSEITWLVTYNNVPSRLTIDFIESTANLQLSYSEE